MTNGKLFCIHLLPPLFCIRKRIHGGAKFCEEIRINDFLSYIGYKPERSLYIPGAMERPYNLKAGAASTGIDEKVGNRESAGSVSALYTKSKKLKPQSGNASGSK